MFVFRSATPDDAEELSCVALETFRDGWSDVIGEEFATAYATEHLSREQLLREIQLPDANDFVLAIEETTSAIIGYGKLDRTRPAHESVTGVNPVLLQRFYVSAVGRGTGVAAALLASCEQKATKNGFATLWLECDPRNERAWRFYEKRGFVARGGAIYYYPNGFNDKIRILERIISQDSCTKVAND